MRTLIEEVAGVRLAWALLLGAMVAMLGTSALAIAQSGEVLKASRGPLVLSCNGECLSDSDCPQVLKPPWECVCLLPNNPPFLGACKAAIAEAPTR